MSIAKMQKISLITKPTDKEQLIQSLQGVQNVEISDLSSEDQELSSEELAKKKNRQYDYYQSWYRRSEQALTTLSRYLTIQPLLSRLTTKRPTYTMSELIKAVDVDQAQSLIQEIEQLSKDRQDLIDQRKKVEQAQNTISNWRALSINPSDLLASKHFKAFLGYLPNDEDRSYFNKIKAADGLAIEEVFSTQEHIGVVLLQDERDDNSYSDLLNNSHFELWDYPYHEAPDKVYDALEDHRLWLNRREQELVENFRSLEAQIFNLQLASETFYNRSQRALVEDLAHDTNYLTYIKGWVSVQDLEKLEQQLARDLDDNQYALIKEEISQKEIDDDQVPIKLENNALVEPFEAITLMYATPNYRETDPTPYLTPFYMLFFGMMMGDLGYGLVMWIVTFLALRFVDMKDSMRSTMKMGHLLSYTTMLVGLAYGTFFGASLPFKLIDPLNQAMQLLIISIAFGFVHMMVALIIKAVTEWRRGDFQEMYSESGGWLLMFLSLALVIAGYVFNYPMLMTIAGVIAIIAAIGMIIVPMVYADKKIVGFASGLYNLYGVSSYLGDFVSYSRLMALGLSGGSIAMAFNMIVGLLPVPLRFTVGIVLIVALHGFNMFLSLLSAYVHGLRLTFVEFFGKFVEGGGRRFKPIDTLQKYIHLSDVNENVENK
ncbi:V-type ATP synthase subunit I [Aerococcus mictus]|uniref:V-type ATP synthase subunit I n=1 Tax=Aerococcus mictus TaxID=2976810 RepID=UPI0018A797E9|nr:V-type ATP synthase subunit I [Aerococcus mictus]